MFLLAGAAAADGGRGTRRQKSMLIGEGSDDRSGCVLAAKETVKVRRYRKMSK